MRSVLSGEMTCTCALLTCSSILFFPPQGSVTQLGAYYLFSWIVLRPQAEWRLSFWVTRTTTFTELLPLPLLVLFFDGELGLSNLSVDNQRNFALFANRFRILAPSDPSKNASIVSYVVVVVFALLLLSLNYGPQLQATIIVRKCSRFK